MSFISSLCIKQLTTTSTTTYIVFLDIELNNFNKSSIRGEVDRLIFMEKEEKKELDTYLMFIPSWVLQKLAYLMISMRLGPK
jgi:hypothetical protein